LITSLGLLRDHPSHRRSNYLHEVLLEPILEGASAVVDFQPSEVSLLHPPEEVAFLAYLEAEAY